MGHELGDDPHALEGEDHDDHDQRPDDPHVALLAPKFGGADLLLAVELLLAFELLAGLEAEGDDGGDDLALVEHAGEAADAGHAGAEADRHVGDAGQLP